MEPIIKIEPMLSQPTGIVLLISTVTIATLSTIQMSLLFLFISFIFDFLTGIYASWVEWKNKKIQITTYLIESKKLRKSVGKAIAYMAAIGFTYGFELVFFIKSFKISASGANLTITLIAVGVCVAIEFFSVLENMKRSGFDLIGKAKKGFSQLWDLFRTAKGDIDTNENIEE
jgi:hypothetical protein